MVTDDITTTGPGLNLDPNSTQLNDLLSTRENQFNLVLQQIYYSKKCSYFYIALLVLSCMLVIVLIVDGFTVAESPLFICLELILNLAVAVDFICRVKLIGFHNFFLQAHFRTVRWWNVFDAFVVVTCSLLFMVSLFKNSAGYVEGTEETLLTLWAVWQTLRIILIAKKQRLAKQSAKTLIDFENIIVDTEFGAQSQRSITIQDNDDNIFGNPE